MHTRGVGAIASRDAVSPRKAIARARRKVARTNARDRVMRTITYGPRGGMSGLGAANLGYQGGSGGVLRQQDIRFDTGKGTVPTPPTGSGGATTTSSWTKAGIAMLAAPSSAQFVTVPRMTIPTDPPPSATDPNAGWNLTGGSTPVTGSGGKKVVPVSRPGTTTSGGGGAPWVPPKPGPDISMPPDVALPDVPVASGGLTKNQKIALVGAAALGAYLLYKNSKKKGGTP